MTGYGVLAVGVLTGAWVWTVMQFIPLASRWLELAEERQVERMTPAPPAPPEPPELRRIIQVPEDLEAVIMDESERWRQDEVRADVIAAYGRYGDWNKVRRAVGVGEMPTA